MEKKIKNKKGDEQAEVIFTDYMIEHTIAVVSGFLLIDIILIILPQIVPFEITLLVFGFTSILAGYLIYEIINGKDMRL